MAVQMCDPLKDPEVYAPAFKVNTYLRHSTKEPGDNANKTKSTTRVSCAYKLQETSGLISLLFTLQRLYDIEKESVLYQRTKCPSRFFQSEASVIITTIQSYPCYKKRLREYSGMFPEVVLLLQNGSLPKTIETKKLAETSHCKRFSVSTTEYFKRMSEFHRLSSLANQINSDVTALTTHKYIPHQLAVLHESLQEMSKNNSKSSYSPVTREIANRFNSLKANTKNNNSNLTQKDENWLMDTTGDLVEYTEMIPPEVNNLIEGLLGKQQ